jgi:tetratricopeptide (TPR) repeat protein
MLRIYAIHPNPGERLILSGLIGGSLVFLAQSCFNFGVLTTYFFFFSLLALGLGRFFQENSGSAATHSDTQTRWLQNKRSLTWIMFSLIWILGAGLLWQSTGIIRAEQKLTYLREAHRVPASMNSFPYFLRAAQALESATVIQAHESFYLTELGRIYKDVADLGPAQDKTLYLNKALAAYEKALKLQPENPWNLNNVAQMLPQLMPFQSRLEDHKALSKRQETLLVKGAAIDKHNPLFLVNAAYFMQTHEKPQAAIEYYDRIIKIDPLFQKAVWINKAVIHRNLGQIEESNKAIAFINDTLNQRVALAQQAAMAGDLLETVTILDNTLKFDPDNVELRFLFVVNKFKHVEINYPNARDETLANIREILSRQPAHVGAREYLEKLSRLPQPSNH